MKINLSFLLLIMAIGGHAFAKSMSQPLVQTNHVIQDTIKGPQPADTLVQEQADEVYLVVDKMPEFPGGTDMMMRFIATNLQYPVEAMKKNQQGRVFVGFIVSADGSIGNINVVRSSGHKLLNDEAVRVVKSMPIWNPGIQKGKAVNVRYTLPVSFKLTK